VDPLLQVLPWVLGSVIFGVGIGFYLGVSKSPQKKTRPTEKQDAATLRVLTSVLEATEQLNEDVGAHNSEIQQVGQQLTELQLDGELEKAQKTLLSEISSVVKANQQLEDDLNYAQLRMEEQAQELDRTRREARTDALSGVANRKGFDEKLKMALCAWKRQRRRFVLVLVDVDHFKWINDTHGHQAGDQVVTQIGQFLRDCVRGDDFVARFGGDEFAILLAGVDLDSGALVAERMRETVALKNFGYQTGTEEATVTFSIGVAAPWRGVTEEAILERADQALYKAKESGRNKVYCYNQEQEGLVPATSAALL